MSKKNQKPIPWFVHIGLGIIVTISALAAPRMRIFLIVGVGFLLWGIIQFFKQKNTAPQKKAVHTHNHQHTHTQKSHAAHPQHQKQHPTHNHTQAQQQQHHTAHNGLYKGCPSCKATIPRNSRFCPYCGFGV
jgi:hypothetical protein